MSDDVIPRYSLVMNTNYWPLKGGPFSSKPWWPQSFAQMFSSRSQGREGAPWSPARNAGPPHPGCTPARAARGRRVGPGSGPAAPAPPLTHGPRAAIPYRGAGRPRAPQADFPPPTLSRAQEEKTIHFNAIGAAAELRRLLLRLRRARFSPRLNRRLRGLQMQAVVASGPGHLGLVGVSHPAATASASAACAEGLRARQWRRLGKR